MNFWTIYLVMQADAIGVGLWILFGTTALGGVAAMLIYHDTRDTKAEMDASVRLIARAWKRWGWILPTLLILAMAMPSTKTMATALIIPAVVNNETIQEEAGELYGIAKDALMKVVEVADEEPKAE